MHALEPLKSVPEHRAVMFPQDRVTNLNYVVRSNTYDKLIERGVMESAECYPVGYHRLPTGLAIRNNVCSLKKLSVPQSTKRTLFSIGFKDTFPKGSLVKPLPHCCCNIGPTRRGILRDMWTVLDRFYGSSFREAYIINCNLKG
jgi:hypothetical protein